MNQTTNLIKTVNIVDSSHMLINLVQTKWWNEKKDINIYQGKLK